MSYQHKRSSVAGKVPTPANFKQGEIIVNTADGKLYMLVGTTVKSFSMDEAINLLLDGKQDKLNFTPVNQNGGTMLADPTEPLGVATRQYVDNNAVMSPIIIESSATWNKPASISPAKLYKIEIWGGGGGGGNGNSGGGGGGGAYNMIDLLGSEIPSSVAITIGAGGNVGSGGGVSSFGAILSANGGSAGSGSNAGAGGAGGSSDIMAYVGGRGGVGGWSGSPSGSGGESIRGGGGGGGMGVGAGLGGRTFFGGGQGGSGASGSTKAGHIPGGGGAASGGGLGARGEIRIRLVI